MSAEQEHTLAFECELAQAPTLVWRALTEPELLAQWLFEGDDSIACEVLESEEERLLRWRWRERELDSVVTFTLAPAVGGGTHLRLEHTGLAGRLREALPALMLATHSYRMAA